MWAVVLELSMSVSVGNMSSVLLLVGPGDLEPQPHIWQEESTQSQNSLDSATPNTVYLGEHSCQLELHLCATLSVLSQ